jgi:hypothetical protein
MTTIVRNWSGTVAIDVHFEHAICQKNYFDNKLCGLNKTFLLITRQFIFPLPPPVAGMGIAAAECYTGKIYHLHQNIKGARGSTKEHLRHRRARKIHRSYSFSNHLKIPQKIYNAARQFIQLELQSEPWKVLQGPDNVSWPNFLEKGNGKSLQAF